MIDSSAALLALRARALTLVAATTGSTTIAATATGYHRTDGGSFVTDGFCAGQEITVSGFAANGTRVIAHGDLATVTASDLTTTTSQTVEAVAAGRTIKVLLPAGRAWINKSYTPVTGSPYLQEAFRVSTHQVYSAPASNGEARETGLYVLTWHGIDNTGTTGILKPCESLRALFAPGTKMTAGSNTVRVRTDIGPAALEVIPEGNGWAACQVQVSWEAYSTNVIAA